MAEPKSQDDATDAAGDKGAPKIILGSMEFGRRLNEQESHEVLTAFLERHKEIDTAFMYQGGKTETIMGKVQQSLLTPMGALIASKAFPKHAKGLTAQGIAAQNQVSLSRLQTRAIDLYYLHWPDHHTDIVESLRAM